MLSSPKVHRPNATQQVKALVSGVSVLALVLVLVLVLVVLKRRASVVKDNGGNSSSLVPRRVAHCGGWIPSRWQGESFSVPLYSPICLDRHIRSSSLYSAKILNDPE